MKATVGLVGVLLLSWVTTTISGEPEVRDLSSQLKVVLTSSNSSVQQGSVARLTARIVNISSAPVAIAMEELGCYVNYSFEPDEQHDGDLGWFGQVIGDSGPGVSPPTLTVLAPGEAGSRELKAPRFEPRKPQPAGRYRVSVEYCHFTMLGTAGAPDSDGCVSSNEVVLSYEP
jgi:hypothetical protein